MLPPMRTVISSIFPTRAHRTGLRAAAPRPGIMAPGIIAAGIMTVSGCAYGEIRHVLRNEVASELDCPSVSVEPRNPPYMQGAREGDNDWKVRGCGTVRTYTCPPDDGMVAYGSTGCTFVDGDVDAPELAKDEGEDLLAAPPGDAPAEEAGDALEPGDSLE